MFTESKLVATGVIKAITEFAVEFEASHTKPNIVFLNKIHLDSIKKYFPYMIKNGILYHNKQNYEIILTQGTSVGLAFSYHSDHILDSNKIN